MIEIIRKYEEEKIVASICQESGLSIHFSNFSDLISCLTNLKNLASSRKQNKTESQIDKLNEQSEFQIRLNAYNFIEKKLTKRNEFKNLIDKRSSIKSSLDLLEKEVEKLETIHSKIQKALCNAREKKNEFDQKKTFSDFGFTYETAKAFIESLGFDAVLTLEDLQSFDPNKHKETKSLEDYVATHITQYIPNEQIQTGNSAMQSTRLHDFFDYSKTSRKDTLASPVTLGNQTYFIRHQSFRNTIHFCLNSPVGGGFAFASDWESMKYAVFCPLKEIKPQVKGSVPQDTFIEGDYNFTNNTVILCPASEKEIMKKQNPMTTIILYDDKQASAHTFMPFVVSNILGYKYLETSPTLGFGDKTENEKFRNLAQNEGFEITLHTNSQSSVNETMQWKIYHNAAVLNIIEQEGLSFDEIKDRLAVEYFTEIDESLISNTLDFLKPAIGEDKFNRLVSHLKLLNKESESIQNKFPSAKNAKAVKTIIDEVSQQSNKQPET